MSTEAKKKSLMIPMRIFCLLLAVVIWVLVVNITSDSFEDSFEIDIKVEGNEALSDKGISVYDQSESKVSVTVRGLREKIRALKTTDFRAYIDVSKLEVAGKHNVDVKISVPEEVAVVSSTPSSVEISIDQIKSLSKIPEVDFKNYSKEKNIEINSFRLDPQILTVTGPDSILKRIDKVRLVANLGGNNLSDSFENIPESIVFYDEKGNVVPQDYLTLPLEQFHIHVTVDQVRTVPLDYVFAEGFDYSGIESVVLSVPSVTVKGEKSRMDSLQKFSIITVGKDTPPESDVPLSSLVLPEGVVFSDKEQAGQTVHVSIRLKPVVTTQPTPETTAAPVESSATEPEA